MAEVLSTGVEYLDDLLGGLFWGDNVIWQVDSGVPVEFYIRSFLRTAAAHGSEITYVSFGHSPQSVISRYVTEQLKPRFHLIDAFTSGFGQDDAFFKGFYEDGQPAQPRITRIPEPDDSEKLGETMAALAETVGRGGCYVFDSPTAMLDLWGGEDRVLKFFSFLCPKLYDLSTVAYWITEKSAHSPAFLAKLLHITQVVLELGVSERGIDLTVRKAADRPRCRIGVPSYLDAADGTPRAEPRRREELEMGLLRDIGQAIGSSLDLREVFDRIMQILGEGLNMRRGTLVLTDPATGTLRIAAAHGLSPEEISRGVYQMGEGVTGTAVATGEPVVVRDIRQDPRFLDRTGARRKLMQGPAISFICVPLRIAEEVVGALSADREFEDAEILEKDMRLLQIVGAMISQAIQINRMVAVEMAELLGRDELAGGSGSRYAVGNIVAASPAMQEVLATANVVAKSDATVLVQGETGTGKELLARVIHSNSPRKDRAFVAVNCGALQDTLLESELFGHVRGAYTGAVSDRAGRFQLADGGTIFLDEVSSMSQQLQVKLLRVLQEKEFERVGSSTAIKVNVRVLAATNVDLAALVNQSQFREDLYYRLNVVSIDVPPLRERREDIPLLVDHFMQVFSQENDKSVTRLSREALDLLVTYQWPGNVRELENCIERAIVLSQTGTITAELLPESVRHLQGRFQPRRTEEAGAPLEHLIADLRQTESGRLYEAVVTAVEESLITTVLAANDGVQTRAARELGLSRNTLRDRMRTFGLLPG
jgi:Nif-specific regulatory protein